MRSRRKKNLLWTWLVLTLVGGMAAVITPPGYGGSTAVLSAPIVRDTTLKPGSAFSIDVNVTDVENMWGFSFLLYYNTTVLNATGVSYYYPFTYTWSTSFNYTAGFAYMAYSMPLGTKIGFSTNETVPTWAIAKIDFVVLANGTSSLDLQNDKLSNPEGFEIARDVSDGFFANIEILVHNLAIIDGTAPSTVPVDGEATVTAVVENQGDYDETFNVTLYANETIIDTQTDITLSVNASTTLTFSWNTTGFAEGTYILKAVASIIPGEIKTLDNTFVYGEVTVGTEEEETPPPDYTLYMVAAAAIVIVLAILVYVFRFRKPKPTG